MDLAHERLDVYHLGLDFLVPASELIEGLPRGRSHLSDQFPRASLSIVLNLAEGAGKHSKPRQATVLSDGARLGDGVSRSAGRLLSAQVARRERPQDWESYDCSHCVNADQVGLSQRRSQSRAHPIATTAT